MPVTVLAIDEAWSKIPPATLKARGYAGAFLYASHDASKAAKPADVEALHAAGMGIGLVFEDNAGRWRGGRAQGLADGQFANQFADGLGWPTNLPIYAAVDQDLVTDADFATALDYIRGFDSAGLRHGRGYGEYDLIQKLYAAGLGDGWQACAWSGSKISSHAAVYQRVKPTTGMTGSFDEDVLLDPTGAGLWYPNTPAAPTASEENDMDFEIIHNPRDSQDYAWVGAAFWQVPNSSYLEWMKASPRCTGYRTPSQGEFDAIRALALSARAAPTTATGEIDVTQLAANLSAQLGPEIGKQLVAALGAALTK